MESRSLTMGAREPACYAIPRCVPTGSLSWERVRASRWTPPFSTSAASNGAKERPATDAASPPGRFERIPAVDVEVSVNGPLRGGPY